MEDTKARIGGLVRVGTRLSFLIEAILTSKTGRVGVIDGIVQNVRIRVPTLRVGRIAGQFVRAHEGTMAVKVVPRHGVVHFIRVVVVLARIGRELLIVTGAIIGHPLLTIRINPVAFHQTARRRHKQNGRSRLLRKPVSQPIRRAGLAGSGVGCGELGNQSR